MRNIDMLKSPSQSNLSSEKLLSVLEVMSELEEPVRLQELSRKLEMNSSTVLRFLTTLQKKEYVAQEIETDRYYLTFKICALAGNLTTRGSLRTIALPFMKQVSRDFGETVSLMVENNLSAVCIEAVNASNSSLKCIKELGAAEPLSCTSAGKLFLLGYSEEKFQYLMEKKGLPQMTENSLCDELSLRSELERVRTEGAAYDNEELEHGVCSVAVPIYDYTGKVKAALCVSGPTSRLKEKNIRQNLKKLMDSAGQISALMGMKAQDV